MPGQIIESPTPVIRFFFPIQFDLPAMEGKYFYYPTRFERDAYEPSGKFEDGTLGIGCIWYDELLAPDLGCLLFKKLALSPKIRIRPGLSTFQ